MIKGVIFDMDGVIVDSEPIHYKIFTKYCSELGFRMSDEEYGTFIGSTNNAIFSAIKEKHNLKESIDELCKVYGDRCVEYYYTASDEKPIEGVDILIKDLYKNNIKLAVASSSPITGINTVTKLFKIEKYFTKLISGSSLENAKPAPDIFLLAAKELGLKPSECVVIEDSKNGVTAAIAAGMKCIGYANPNSGNQDISRADVIIDSFLDINYESIQKMF